MLSVSGCPCKGALWAGLSPGGDPFAWIVSLVGGWRPTGDVPFCREPCDMPSPYWKITGGKPLLPEHNVTENSIPGRGRCQRRGPEVPVQSRGVELRSATRNHHPLTPSSCQEEGVERFCEGTPLALPGKRAAALLYFPREVERNADIPSRLNRYGRRDCAPRCGVIPMLPAQCFRSQNAARTASSPTTTTA